MRNNLHISNWIIIAFRIVRCNSRCGSMAPLLHGIVVCIEPLCAYLNFIVRHSSFVYVMKCLPWWFFERLMWNSCTTIHSSSGWLCVLFSHRLYQITSKAFQREKLITILLLLFSSHSQHIFYLFIQKLNLTNNLSFFRFFLLSVDDIRIRDVLGEITMKIDVMEE